MLPLHYKTAIYSFTSEGRGPQIRMGSDVRASRFWQQGSLIRMGKRPIIRVASHTPKREERTRAGIRWLEEV
jgi:hypothetical protein